LAKGVREIATVTKNRRGFERVSIRVIVLGKSESLPRIATLSILS